MPNTYPARVRPTDAALAALLGTTDSATGVPFINYNSGPNDSPTLLQKLTWQIYQLTQDMAAVCNAGRVEVETNAGLTFGVNPLFYVLSGTAKSFTGATAQSFTNSATNYVYLNSSNALTISTSSFPADITTYVPLATVICAGGVVTSYTDSRGYAAFRITDATSTGSTGTTQTSWTLDSANAGAANNPQLRANRGSTNAEDAAMEWNESAGAWRARSQHSTDTLASMDAAAYKVAGVTVANSTGAAKVQDIVAGPGLTPTAGILSVKTATSSGTGIGAGSEVNVQPSDGIKVDANGVAIKLNALGGLKLDAAADGTQPISVKTDDLTITKDGSGNVVVKDGGLTGAKAAVLSTASGNSGAIPVCFYATVTAGATVTIHNSNAPFKHIVIGIEIIENTGAGGTIYVDNGTNVIVTSITLAGVVKTKSRDAKIDTTYSTIALNGSLRVVGDGSLANCNVIIHALKVA